MNTGIVTTGLQALITGSDEVFLLNAVANGLFWNLAGGSAILQFTGPFNVGVAVTATITDGVARAAWRVLGAGTWFRQWIVQDATGIRQISQHITFEVNN